MEQKKLVIVLADISGYTGFMVENQTTAVHGEVFISALIEALIKHVVTPFTFREKTKMMWQALLSPLIIRRLYPTIVERVHARGRRREPTPE